MARESHNNHSQGEGSPDFNGFAASYSTPQDVAKPATDLSFPSVTICSPGLNMEVVKEVLFKDFQRWSKEEGNSQKDVDDFMKEMYAMKVGQGSIVEKIKTMALPQLDHNDGQFFRAMEWLMFFFRPPLPSMVLTKFDHHH